MRRRDGIVRTGGIPAVGAALCWATACGAVVGDLGASEQAAKDLRTLHADHGGSRRGSDSSRCKTGRTASRPEDERCAEAGGAAADHEVALASDHWLWMSRHDAAGPADPGEAGSWLWVTASGSLGWSPGKVSATPVVGAVRVQRPDGGSGPWYWSPASGAGVPVYGGAGVAPVDPRDVGWSVSDPPKGCGSKAVKQSRSGGSPGRVDRNGQLTPSEFSWVLTGSATEGSSTTVSGVVGMENRATPTQIDVAVVGGHRTVSAIRVTTSDGVRSGSAVASSASVSVCAPVGSGVEPDVAVAAGGDDGDATITICDAALADLLLG